jgi:hypothetical protein
MLLHCEFCVMCDTRPWAGPSIVPFPAGLDIFIVSKFSRLPSETMAGSRIRYSDWLWVGRSGDRIPVAARFSAPVQTGPGAHPASCKMSTESVPGVKSGREVTLTTYPLLVPWSWKGRAIPLFRLWAIRPVQSLSACSVELYLYSPYGPYGLYRASVPVQ